TMVNEKIVENGEYVLPECTFTAPSNFEAWEVDGVRKNVGDTIIITKDTEIKAIWSYVGAYIDYAVEYTDVYTNYEFSGDYGWRLLSKEDNGDGTSDIEIISTGMPAKLYYSYSSVHTSPWGGDSNQRTQYKNDYYASLDSNTGNRNMYGASGLLYNFEKIEFSQGTGTPAKDKGLYVEVNRSQNSGDGLFKADNLVDKEIKVRSVMHADLKPESAKQDIGKGTGKYTDAAEGLFTLKDLTITPYSKGQYYLASPCNDNYNSLRYVEYTGNVINFDGNTSSEHAGVRPVVSISDVTVYYDNGVWRIKNVLPEYTVTFNANSGSGTMADVKVTTGREYTLPECTFTAPVPETGACKFWCWEVNGESKNIGDKIVITEDTEIKAIWVTVIEKEG
ncbi:MAG: hypothetical protein IJX34_03715, partial [Clostridia bacterium]|nr:hypothetical protein [Clostridia bacterium]